MKKATRRLTIYPGQISLVFYLQTSENFHSILKETLPDITDSRRRKTVERFLDKMESAIATGKKLIEKESALARGNC